MADRREVLGFVAVCAAFLAGCASRVAAPRAIKQPAPPDFPEAHYRRLLLQGQPVFSVDAARSRVVIEVRRAGSLARFGHDHVVASHDLAGRIAPHEGRADLWLPLDALVVDEASLRAEAGFQTQPSVDDIAGTRHNMLAAVLQTDRNPFALIHVNDVGPDGSGRRLRLAITLHGVTQVVETVVQIDQAADELSVTGTLALDQSRFGIAPFSILGGAVAVRDRLDLSFRLRARRMDPVQASRGLPAHGLGARHEAVAAG